MVRHTYIDLRRAMFAVLVNVGEIILSYAHNHFAVLVATARELDTVVGVKAKRQQCCSSLSDWHA